MRQLITIVFLLALNGFFVAAEFALVRSRRTRLEAMVRRGDPLAKIALRCVDNLTRMLSASQLGITFASLALGWAAENAFGHLVAGWLSALPSVLQVTARASVAAGIALAAASYLHVVFGELYPRAIALNNPEIAAKWLAPPLLAFAWVARPVIVLFETSARTVLRLTGQRPYIRQAPLHEADEIRLIVEQSEEGGKLEREPAQMLGAVFEFTEKKARDVMTPRTRIVAVPADVSLDDALRTVEETKFSRYPVYQETLDDVVGVLLAKDLLAFAHREPPEFDVRRVMRSVHFVPGSREVEEVLADFKRHKAHLAIVLDEFGGTAGLVTMEDLIEELVGEIYDEHDETQAVSRAAGGETVLDGATPVADVNERFGTQIPDGDYTTIGGVIFGALGRLPVAGDRAAVGGAWFVVKSMDGRRIAELVVTKS